MENDFKLWDGSYDKTWYDIRLPSGEVLTCWPNAGCMMSMDGSGRTWLPKDNIEVRFGQSPFNKV